MKRYFAAITLLLLAGAAISGCGAGSTVGDTTVTPMNSSPTPSSAGGDATPTSPTSPAASTYPKLGHALNYSWIAGKVVFTKIQGGCIYIRIEEPPATSQALPTGTIVGPIVGTASKSDVSPPLRDITPVAISPDATPQGPIGPMFVPGGQGWDSNQVKDGDYVVAFGHLTGAGEPREMCPGGTAYTIDRLQANP